MLKNYPMKDKPTYLKHGENTLPPIDCGQCQIPGCRRVADFQCWTKMPKITDINFGTKTEVPCTNCDRFICEEHAVESTYFETRLTGRRRRGVQRDLYYCRACPDCTEVNQNNWREAVMSKAKGTNTFLIVVLLVTGAWIPLLMMLLFFWPLILPLAWFYYKRYQQAQEAEAERKAKL